MLDLDQLRAAAKSSETRATAFSEARKRLQRLAETAEVARHLKILSGAHLGPQLHLGNKPEPATFPAVEMVTPGIGYRPFNQAWGGLWTATLLDNGASSFVTTNYVIGNETTPAWLTSMDWWILRPDPGAYILELDSEQSLDAALAYFRYQGGAELDFKKIHAAGFHGVHVTSQAVGDVAGLRDWMHESTHWLRWAFAAEPEATTPPDWLQARADEQPLEPIRDDGSDRVYLHGPLKGFWIETGKPSPGVAGRLRRLLKLRDRGASSVDDGQLVLLAIGKLFVDEMIVAHNFTDRDGRIIPPGPGLFDALGPAVALGLMDAWSLTTQRRHGRAHPSTRLAPTPKRSILSPERLLAAMFRRR